MDLREILTYYVMANGPSKLFEESMEALCHAQREHAFKGNRHGESLCRDAANIAARGLGECKMNERRMLQDSPMDSQLEFIPYGTAGYNECVRRGLEACRHPFRGPTNASAGEEPNTPEANHERR